MSDTSSPTPKGEPAGGDAASSDSPPEGQGVPRPSVQEPDAAEVDVGESGADNVAGEAEHADGAESGAASDRTHDQLGVGRKENAKVSAGESEESEEERARLVREAELERKRNTEKMQQSLASRRKTSFEEVRTAHGLADAPPQGRILQLEEAETKRRQQLADRFILTETYWERMKWHLEAGKTVNKALVAHFGEVAAAHKAYAAALSKVRFRTLANTSCTRLCGKWAVGADEQAQQGGRGVRPRLGAGSRSRRGPALTECEQPCHRPDPPGRRDDGLWAQGGRVWRHGEAVRAGLRGCACG